MTRNLVLQSPASEPSFDDINDEAALDILGPAWSNLSQAQRDRLGPPLPARASDQWALDVDDLDDVLWYKMTFPRSIMDEGFGTVMRRMGARPSVIALGDALDDEEPSPVAPTAPRIVPDERTRIRLGANALLSAVRHRRSA